MGKTLTFNPANIIFGSAGALGATEAGPGVILTAAQLRDAADLASTDSATFAGLTLTGNLLFTDNTYNIGALGATRPASIFVGTKINTPWLDNSAGTLTLGNASQVVAVSGRLQTKTGSSSAPAITGADSNSGIYWRGSDDIICFGTNGIPLLTMSDAYAPMYNVNLASGLLFGWSSSANPESTFQDAAFARVSASTIELNNGTRVSSGGTVGTLCVGTVKNTAAALNIGHSTVGVTVAGDLRLATSYGLSLDGATFSAFLVKSSTASSGTRLVASSGTGLSFEIGSGTTVGRFAQTTGNFLIGTTTDDATNKLQVAGGILATSVNNASAALTLGNSTYGVTVPGPIATPKITITVPDGGSTTPFIVSVPDHNPYAAQFLGRNTNKSLYVWMDNSGNGNLITDNAFVVQTGGYGNTRLTIASTGAATFSGDISMQKATQGYIRAYATDAVKNAALYHDGTDGNVTTSSGSLNLSPTTGVVWVNGTFLGVFKSGSNAGVTTYDGTGTKTMSMSCDGAGYGLLNSSGNIYGIILNGYAGRHVGVGSSDLTQGKFVVRSNDTAVVSQVIITESAQTADAFRVVNSAFSTLAKIDASGNFTAVGGTFSGNVKLGSGSVGSGGGIGTGLALSLVYQNYGFGVDGTGTPVVVYNSLQHQRLGNATRVTSSGSYGFTSSSEANQNATTDVQIVRYATGPALEVNAAGGLRVRDLAGSADAAITGASIKTVGGVNRHEHAGTLRRYDSWDGICWASDYEVAWSAYTYANKGPGGDVKFKRYSTGPSFEIDADGGLRVRNYAGSADAPLTAGTTTLSGDLNLGANSVVGAYSGIYNTGKWLTGSDGFGSLWISPSNAGINFSPPASFGVIAANIDYAGRVQALSSFNLGHADFSGIDVSFARNATGPKASIRAAGGLEVRNLAGSADAPITCAGITASGQIKANAGAGPNLGLTTSRYSQLQFNAVGDGAGTYTAGMTGYGFIQSFDTTLGVLEFYGMGSVSAGAGQSPSLFGSIDAGGILKWGTNIRSYDAPYSKFTSLTHNGTDGVIGTSSGNLNLVPAGGTVSVTGAITATTYIDAASIRCDGSQVFDTSGTALDVGGAGGFTSVRLGINSGASGLKILLGRDTSASSAPMLKIAQDATTVQFRNTNDSADAAITCAGITASGNVSMQRTSAQGYVQAWDTTTAKNIHMYHDGVGGHLGASAGYLVMDQQVAFGGTGASTPGLTWSGSTLKVRYADMSADAPLTCAAFTASGNVAITGTTATPLTITTSSASSAIYFNQTTTGNHYFGLQYSGATKWLIGNQYTDHSLVVYNANASAIVATLTQAGNFSCKGTLSTGATETVTITHNATDGIISTSTGELRFSPWGGTTNCYVSGTNSALFVKGATAAGYIALTHNDTSYGQLAVSTGDLLFTATSSLFCFGGRTSSYPAIKRSSTAIAFRLADDTADAPITAAAATFSGIITGSSTGSNYLAGKLGIGVNPATSKLEITSNVTTDTIATFKGMGAHTGLLTRWVEGSTEVASMTPTGKLTLNTILQTAEITVTPSGTTQTLTLNDGNYQSIDLTSSTGDVTVTLAVPTSSGKGSILIKQHATTARDITWAASAGSIVWLGSEPSWNADATSAYREVSWRFNGTNTYLSSSGSS